MNYYTCDELLHKYPLTKLWGWTAVKIGVFYNCLLLDGKRFGKKGRIMVSESSFENLMEYVHYSATIAITSEDCLSYDEILDLIPQAVYYRWTPTSIGIFFHSRLLYGKQSSKESRNLILKQSAVRLIEFTNQRFENIRLNR